MRFIVTLFVLLLFLYSNAQYISYETWLAQQARCDSMGQVAMERIPEYFEAEKPTEVWATIEKWQKLCGMNETLCATLAFFDLISGGFEEQSPPTDLLYCFHDYAEMNTTGMESEQIIQLALYRSFLKNNVEAIDTLGLNQDEKFIRSFFVDEKNFSSLSSSYPEAMLSKDYIRITDSLSNKPEVNAGIYAGYFVPLGNNKIFGNHFLIGGNVKLRSKKHTFGFEADLKLGNSEEAYETVNRGQLEETNGFNAASINLFYGQRFFENKSHSFGVRGGFGWDFITAFPAQDLNGDGQPDIEATYLRSFNINLGLLYSLRTDQGTLIEPGVFYNITNFHNEGGTNIKGNYITFRVLVSFSLDAERYETLSRLR